MAKMLRKIIDNKNKIAATILLILIIINIIIWSTFLGSISGWIKLFTFIASN